MQFQVKKWQKVTIDFVKDLPDSDDGINSILTVIDKATRMIHLIYCSKLILVAETARLFMMCIVGLQEVPRYTYNDKGTQFVSKILERNLGIIGHIS